MNAPHSAASRETFPVTALGNPTVLIAERRKGENCRLQPGPEAPGNKPPTPAAVEKTSDREDKLTG